MRSAPLDIARAGGGRRARGRRPGWRTTIVAHSVIPVGRSDAAKFFDIGATLYFINVPVPRLTDALADFLGAPRAKVIASLFLTAAGGGATPHFDKNENFTIQFDRAKRWIVGETPMVEAPPDGYVLGQHVPPSLVRAAARGARAAGAAPSIWCRGTLLYVPRGTVHRTGAGVLSWSLNLSYAPAMWMDLFRVGLRRRLAGSPRWRGIVTGAAPGADPAAQAANRLGRTGGGTARAAGRSGGTRCHRPATSLPIPDE